MDWKNVVAKVAPWIGTALGGPLGVVAAALAAAVWAGIVSKLNGGH